MKNRLHAHHAVVALLALTACQTAVEPRRGSLHVSIAPEAIDFGLVAADAGLRYETVVVDNATRAPTHAIEAVIVGEGAGAFAIHGSATTCFGRRLLGGERCTIGVRVERSAGVGDHAAVLRIVTGPAPAQTVEIPLAARIEGLLTVEFAAGAPPDPGAVSVAAGASLPTYCSGPCEVRFTTKTVTLTVFPFRGSYFDGFEAGPCTVSPCALTPTGPERVVVIFRARPETVLMPYTSPTTTDQTLRWTFSGTIYDGSPATSYECSFDGAAWTACTSPFVAGPFTGGVHTFAVRALDAAGRADLVPATDTVEVVAAP